MYRALVLVIIYCFGLWWCYEVIRRFKRDVNEITELKDTTRTVVIIFVWILTIIIAVLLVIWGYEIFKRAPEGF
jgi:uncharacterized membrane protein SpoIIM required for sporulation